MKKFFLSLLAIVGLVLVAFIVTAKYGLIEIKQETVLNMVGIYPNDEMRGRFTVNENGDQVVFSRGNLQYQPSTGTWKLAKNQWDILGSDNSDASKDNTKWIDLFGWGTSDDPMKNGEFDTDYAEFNEWGTQIPTSEADHPWRTLSAKEWKYLFFERENAMHLFGLGSVNGVNGLIILPDNWDGQPITACVDKGMEIVEEEEEIEEKDETDSLVGFEEIIGEDTVDLTESKKEPETYFLDSHSENHFADNVYTKWQWNKLAKRGAIFLPATGYREGTDLRFVNEAGQYWSSTPDEPNEFARYFGFTTCNVLPSYYTARRDGLSVRLVKQK